MTFHDDDLLPDDAAREDDASSASRKALAETGLGVRDGHHEPVQPPRVQGGRADRQRPRGAPVRAGQGAAQRRPGGLAGRQDVRAVGRPRGRRARRRQGRAGRARPLRRGAEHRCAPTSSTRATTSGSPWSPSPTSRAATSCCRPSVTRSPSSPSSTHPEMVGLNPEVGHEEMAGLNFAHGIAQALWHGKLFHIDLNGQHGPRFDQDLRFGAGNLRGRVLDGRRPARGRAPGNAYDGFVHFDYKPPRAEAMDGVWESAARLHAQLPDPAGAGRRRSGPTPRWPAALAAAEVESSAHADPRRRRVARRPARGDVRPGGACATRSVGMEALDQLAMEHLLGVALTELQARVRTTGRRDVPMTRPITLFTGQWADLPFEEVCQARLRVGLRRAGDRLLGRPLRPVGRRSRTTPTSRPSGRC